MKTSAIRTVFIATLQVPVVANIDVLGIGAAVGLLTKKIKSFNEVFIPSKYISSWVENPTDQDGLLLGVKYRCVKRTGSTREQCVRFCSTVARRGQCEQLIKGCLRSLTMTAPAEFYA